MSDIIFETDRLTLRKFAQGDWQRLQAFGSLPEVASMMTSLTSPWPEEAIKAWIAEGEFKGVPGFRAGICLKTGFLIGFAGIGPAPSRCAYALDPAYAGQGYATEILAGLMEFAFNDLGLSAIEADHFVDNPASGNVMRKVGFQKIGEEMASSMGRVDPAMADVYKLTPQTYSPPQKRT